MRSQLFLMAVVIAGVAVEVPAQNTYWIPASAHAAGVGGSVWRTDLALANLGDESASVEIRLHADGQVTSSFFDVAVGQQRVVEDVVEPLGSGDTTGSIEVVASERLTVRSRTYNSAATGTFGQALDGITSLNGLAVGESARLVQLREDTAFRCNIGAVNMGNAPATLRLSLFESSGAAVGTYDLEILAGELRQDGRPFASRFGHTNVDGGFALVEVVDGDSVYVYASVVDNRTGDPTTISMEPLEACSEDR